MMQRSGGESAMPPIEKWLENLNELQRKFSKVLGRCGEVSVAVLGSRRGRNIWGGVMTFVNPLPYNSLVVNSWIG